ncbi:MAG: hypothetical protein NWQ46_09520 [Spirosomaceae bacterium]|nr:hypothetical protein [Spirosomataceae bacterium]
MKNYILAFAVLFLFSCEKDDPVIENEEELITTMTYRLTATDGTVVEGKFQDLDGEGGNPPVITPLNLRANTTYTGSLTLLNELENPAENITEEVAEEDREHQFFFQVSGANLTVAYADVDGDNNPVGLRTTVTTSAASTGTLSVTLRHEPNKSAAGVSAGNITNAGGETDINVVFNVVIQ